MCVCVFISLFVHVHDMCMCLCVCLPVCLCIYIERGRERDLCVCVPAGLFVCIHVCLSLSSCLWVCMCVCTCVCVHACVCVCVCVCVCLSDMTEVFHSSFLLRWSSAESSLMSPRQPNQPRGWTELILCSEQDIKSKYSSFLLSVTAVMVWMTKQWSTFCYNVTPFKERRMVWHTMTSAQTKLNHGDKWTWEDDPLNHADWTTGAVCDWQGEVILFLDCLVVLLYHSMLMCSFSLCVQKFSSLTKNDNKQNTGVSPAFLVSTEHLGIVALDNWRSR